MIFHCPHCHSRAQLVTGAAIYPHRPDLAGERFWQCAPCDAWVGVHKSSKDAAPLGRLANADLRRWKQRAHAVFDPWWRSRGLSRTVAYTDMAQRMGLHKKQARIGKFDVDQCKRVVALYSTEEERKAA